MRRKVAVLAALVVLCAIASRASAQQSVNTATISGRVSDKDGVIPGATVTARHAGTSVTTTVTTDEHGRFRLILLPLGTYELRVTMINYAPEVRTLTLAVGAAVDVELKLTPGKRQETVTVDGDRYTMFDTARSSIAGGVASGEIRNLPINGRNFLDLSFLVPGVSPTNIGGGTQFFPETSAVPGVGLSIGSQRNLSNNFLVDGLSANDDAAALTGMPYAMDAIDQFQVITNGGQAELGRALAGYINIVTKSGSNRFEAEFHEFARSSRFSAANALSGEMLPLSQHQYGFGLGGPIVSGRTFFYGNLEQRRLDQSGLVTVSDASVAVINAKLASVGYPGSPIVTGVFDNPVDTTNLLAKIDHSVTARDRLTFRYTAYDARSTNARGAGGVITPSASTALDNLDQTVAVSNVWILSSRTVLETRAQIATSDLKAPPSDPIGPAVTIQGVATFGTASGAPTARTNRMYEIVNNVSYLAGDHSVRAGVDVLYNDLDITYPRSVRGAYTFSSLANFLAGTYNNSGFTQTFGESDVHQTNPNLGMYVQDAWRIRDRLTLNAGVRYDLQWMDAIETDTNNVSPRVGFAWTVTSDDARARYTVVRGNAGLFFDRVPLRAVANALLSAGNTTDVSQLRQIAVSLSPTQSGAPVFPNILSGVVPTTTLVNFSTIDPNLQNAYSRQASLEVEHQFRPSMSGSDMSVSVGYEHLRGFNLLMQINQNVPTCTASGNNNGCRPNPVFANNNRYSSAGSSVYDGLHIALQQRLAPWGSYRVSYTYSKSFNNVGEAFFNSPIDPTDVSKDWGRSDDDIRHKVVLSGSANTSSAPATSLWEHLSHGFTVSGVWQYYSALPFNITSGVTTIQGTAGRPIVDGELIPRNSGEGDAFSSVSVRVSRQFRFGRASVEALVEGFNLLNTRNDVARVGVFGAGAYPTNPAPNFGQITVVGDPRSLQFGLRFTY